MGIYRTNNPTEFDDVDGIIIDESAPSPNIVGVPSNIAILVGQFQRGPEAELTSIGRIGDFNELFGKSDFSGNKELKNKKFGRLKIIRAIASDAVAANVTLNDEDATAALGLKAKYKGAYGNNIQYKIEDAAGDIPGVAEVTRLTPVADVAGSLDGTYFILQDKDGSVAFWIDNGDSGTVEPAHGADRSVEINTIADGDTLTQVRDKLVTAIGADSQFSVVLDTNDLLITDAATGVRAAASAGTSGFVLAEETAGVDAVDAGFKLTIRDNNDGAVIADEVYNISSVVGLTQGDLNKLFAGSSLIEPVAQSPLAVKNPANVASFTNLASGSDGTIADTDYETAIAVAEQERAGNVLWSDKYNSNIKGYLKQHVLNAPDKMVVIAPDDENVTKSAAITEVANYRDAAGAIIYAFNHAQTSIDGVNEYVSPAGVMASVISNTSPHIDPAAASNVDFTAGISGLKNALSRQDYIDLKEAGISALENDPDLGIKFKSGIVTQIINSSKVTILRRRMAYWYTDSVAFFLKNYQNLPNTEANRKQVKGSIIAWDNERIKDGILPADSEVSSGKARLVDTESLNTDLSIGLGFFKILIKRRIFSSMRYIVVQAEIGETVVVTEGEE